MEHVVYYIQCRWSGNEYDFAWMLCIDSFINIVSMAKNKASQYSILMELSTRRRLATLVLLQLLDSEEDLSRHGITLIVIP